MRITAVVNPKGGTGKTTTAVNLAASAALQGERVLLVDLDKQGSATQWLAYSPDNDDLVSVLVEGKPLDEIVVPTLIEDFKLVPASVTLVHTERLTKEPGHQFLLKETSPRDWVSEPTINASTSLQILRQTYTQKVLRTVIPRNTDLRDAHFNKTDIYSFNPRAKAALAYEKLIREVFLPELSIRGRQEEP